jgi:hypothetical protein
MSTDSVVLRFFGSDVESRKVEENIYAAFTLTGGYISVMQGERVVESSVT